jgi:hypothetical protein
VRPSTVVPKVTENVTIVPTAALRYGSLTNAVNPFPGTFPNRYLRVRTVGLLPETLPKVFGTIPSTDSRMVADLPDLANPDAGYDEVDMMW